MASPDPEAALAIDPDMDSADATRPPKRPRSPSLGMPAAVASADMVGGDLSPKKIPRLAGGSRFADAPSTDALSSHPLDNDNDDNDNDTEHIPDGNADDYAAQTALSVLRGAEALMSQKAASDAAHANEVMTEAAAAVAAAASDESTDDNAAQIISDATAAASAAAALAEAAEAAEHMLADVQDGRAAALYPPPPAAADSHGVAAAQAAFPDLVPKSPSSKKHKCPYCDTEFTRHHNLKSHLLTHSQEKPYICQGCDMRFRRLHDLKRHSKLHTGEKPHICPRCDRKFARGDALARHSKGAGGCAGRRSSSSGHFGGATGGTGDDSFDASGIADPDSSVMTGLEYDHADDDERRRLSLPVSKLPHGGRGGRASTDTFTAATAAATHARSYPLLPDSQRAAAAAAAAAVAGGLYPPTAATTAGLANGALTASASAARGHTPNSISAPPIGVNAGTASLFSQHGIAESPKALSPAVGDANAQQFAHRLAASDLQMRNGSSSSSNGDTNANIFSSEQGMWTYIQTLENKLKIQDEKLRQQDERIALLEATKLGYEARISSLTKCVAVRGPESGMLLDAAVCAVQGADTSADAPADATVDTPMEEPAKAPQPAAEQDAEQDAEQQLEQQIGQQLESLVQ